MNKDLISMYATPVPPEQVLEALGMESAFTPASADDATGSSSLLSSGHGAALSATMDAIDKANAAIVGGLAAPQGIIRVLPMTSMDDEGFFLCSGSSGNGTFIPCKGHVYEGASHVALAVATIGPDLERRVKDEFDSGDPLAGIVLDAMGTISLRGITTRLREICVQRAAQLGMKVGPRIAPGCEAMPLEAQRALFSLLDTSAIGVTLNNSLLMTPLKSTSFVLPLGSDLPDRLRKSAMCHTCPHRDRCMRIIL